jgi:hypothetical protein
MRGMSGVARCDLFCLDDAHSAVGFLLMDETEEFFEHHGGGAPNEMVVELKTWNFLFPF